MSTLPASNSVSSFVRQHPAMLVAVVAALWFLPSLGAGFVYDDTLLIAENVRVQRWQGIFEAFTSHFWSTDERIVATGTLVYYRPLVTASFALDWLIFGGAAWGLHLVNVLLHGLTAWLATRLALRWLGKPWLAIAVGIVFAVHPTRSESVIWIVGRTDIFMALFCLLGLEAARAFRRSRRLLPAAACVFSFVAALLSKEGSFVFPLLLWADALVDEPERLSTSSRRLLWACVAVAVGYVTLRAVFYPVRSGSPSFNLPYGLMTVATYVERIVWPWPQTFFYRNVVLGPDGRPVYPVALVLLGAVACVAYGWGWRAAFRRDRAAAIGLLAALLFLAPVLNFFETKIWVTVSDHFLYLPLLLLAVATARALREALERLPTTALVTAVTAFSAVSLVPISLRAADYRDDEALWKRELELTPSSPPALEWLAVSRARQGRLREALILMQRALSPTARRYALLSPPGAASGRWLRVVELTAALTPDGDRLALQALYDELRGYWMGRPGPPGRVGSLELGRDRGQALVARELTEGGRNLLAAELTIIASRLGRHDDARRWLQKVSPNELRRLTNPLNLVLAAARSGDFSRAERLRASLAADSKLSPELLRSLGQRLERARQTELAARQAPPARAQWLRALSMLELGGYLEACRSLRLLYEQKLADPEVAQLYAQALTAARLDAEARRVIEAALGPERAEAVQASLLGGLSPFLRELSPAPDGDAWWRD